MIPLRATTLLLAVVAGLAAPAKSPGSEFGPRQVWRMPEAAVADLHECRQPSRGDCVRRVLRRHGASAEAFEFYRRTGWFLSDLKDTGGRVMLASVVDPWRANENEQPALLGGKPAVVFPERVSVVPEKDAGFRALRAEFPRLLFWKPGPAPETNTITAKGQSFIFRYRLLDGCHACAIRGWARVELDFGPDGTYRGAKLLDVVRAGNSPL